MMWTVMVLVIICLIIVLVKRSTTTAYQHESFLPSPLVDGKGEEEVLGVIFTAAIHELVAERDFEVVKIKHSAKNWTLTGRQNSISNR